MNINSIDTHNMKLILFYEGDSVTQDVVFAAVNKPIKKKTSSNKVPINTGSYGKSYIAHILIVLGNN